MSGSVGLIFTEDYKQVLLVKRRDVPVWDLPCGGMDRNESPEDCVIREVFEETGLNVIVKRPVAIYNNTWKGGLIHSFECEVVGGSMKLTNESKGIDYHSVRELPKLRTLFVEQHVKDALAHEKEIIKADLQKFPLSFYMLKAFRHPVVALRYFLAYNGIHINT
mgnify:CR=1 FL=1